MTNVLDKRRFLVNLSKPRPPQVLPHPGQDRAGLKPHKNWIGCFKSIDWPRHPAVRM